MHGGTKTFGLRFRGYSVVPGTAVGLHSHESRTLITAADAAHLTNPNTRGVMLATVLYGADRAIYLKCLSVCAGVESNST